MKRDEGEVARRTMRRARGSFEDDAHATEGVDKLAHGEELAGGEGSHCL